jgi:poly(A) polymerase
MALSRKAWDQILTAKDADQGLEDLQESGILRAAFPALQGLVGFGGKTSGYAHKDLWMHTKLVVVQTLPVAVLRWAALFHDVGKPSSISTATGKVAFHNHEIASARIFSQAAKQSRLFTGEEEAKIGFIIENLGKVEAYYPEWSDSAVRRLALELGTHLDDVFAVARADCTTSRPAQRRKVMRLTHELRSRITRLQKQAEIPQALPKGLGDALKAHLGLSQGLELGKVMAGLKARVEAGELPRNAPIEIYIESLEKS